MGDLVSPEVVYCGFARISEISRRDQLEKDQLASASQEITVAVSVIGNARLNLTTAIHKQADIQTLARTIEALWSEKRIVVACLIDLGSENVLRWSDTVDDVLDGDSAVGVIPLSEATLIRTMQLPGIPPDSPLKATSHQYNTTSTTKSHTAPIPQLEFIQVDRPNGLSARANSYSGSATVSINSTNDNYYIDTALVRKRSDLRKPMLKALRVLKPNGVRVPSDISLPTVEPFATSYLPPLPSSPIPKAVADPLSVICSNSILLLAFCRYCARKKTLSELLCWLDTTSNSTTPSYVERVYLAVDSPLRLNLPREVSTVIEARELLRDGVLAWSHTGFELSPEGLFAQRLGLERPSLFQKAAITLSGEVHPDRKSFIELLVTALDPEDTSILSLKERKFITTRQAILDQVCGQYFPSGQVDTQKYFEYSNEQLTKPERVRLSNRRTMYGRLFDTKQLPSDMNVEHTNGGIGPRSTEVQKDRSRSAPILTAPLNQIDEVMPMEDADDAGWSEVQEQDKDQMLNKEKNVRDSVTLGSSHTLPAILLEGGASRSGMATPPLSPTKDVPLIARSIASSSVSEEPSLSQAPVELSDSQKADLLKRQAKLRALLGASPREVIEKQTDDMTYEMIGPDYASRRRHSPSPSIASHYSAASSRLSLTRAEKDEAADRRAQIRRAAKLYAMFGEHADSAASVPSYRQDSRSSFGDLARPPSVASLYQPRLKRTPSKSSMSAQSMYQASPNNRTLMSDTSSARYHPDRDGTNRGFRGFKMFRSTKETKLSSSDILAHFPVPPSTTANSSPASQATRRFSSRGGPGSYYGGASASLYGGDDESIMEVDSDEEDEEGEAIVQDVRTSMKLRQLLGNEAPTHELT